MTNSEFKNEMQSTATTMYHHLKTLAAMSKSIGQPPATSKQICYLADKLAYEITRDGKITEELLEDAALDATGWNFTVLSKMIASEAIDLLS